MFINGNVTIANNTVPNMESSASGYGGGIYLYQSDFTVNSGSCTIAKNQAMKGGGIYASSSVISVRQYASLKFLDNTAHTVGGGIYAEASARLNLLELETNDPSESSEGYIMTFNGNCAELEGEAIFMNDNTTSNGCSNNTECFVQLLALHPIGLSSLRPYILFEENFAPGYGV